jgi:cellulose biosynthesis protein BcsQ
MVDVVKFFEKLFQLIQHRDLWGPLFIVLSTTVIACLFFGFWFGRHYPKVLPSLPGSMPDDPRIKELEGKLQACTVNTGELEGKLQACNVNTGELEARLKEALEREAKHDKLHKAILDDESELWRLHEPCPPSGYSNPINVSRPKIIVVANNKGGVGKTTLTAGLAAYFEKKNKRVLLIDLDYQGSLTSWMLRAAGIHIPTNQPHRLAHANKLLDGNSMGQWEAEALSNGHGGGMNAQLVTADYTLTDHETKLMLRWIQTGGKPDVRYHLAEALMSKHVQDEENGFDIVLIDAPPRLTTGTVGALVASTHLIVPTVLDPLSAETVGSFLRQVWNLRATLNLGLELAGVVGTMTPARPLEKPLGTPEENALSIVRLGLKQWQASTHVFSRDIQELAAIKNVAGRQNPYDCRGRVTEMFDDFGDEVCGRIRL